MYIDYMYDFQRKNTRGKIEILASILFHCRNGIRKTHIMCRANLGHHQLSYYLPCLINSGLLTQVMEDGSVVYRITDNGREFLKLYYGIVELIRHEDIALPVGRTRDDIFYELHREKLNNPEVSILDEVER